jgi:hypothetical protein
VSETGGLGPARLGGLDPTKVVVITLIVLADLAVLAALVAVAVWIL